MGRKKKTKICPFLTIAGCRAEGGLKECLQEKCAFYCSWNDYCAFVSIAAETGTGRNTE